MLSNDPRVAPLVRPASDVQPNEEVAVMLTGGGARAAYQVGLLRGIARHFPRFQFRIITGVSAGAINAIFLAASVSPFPDKVERLSRMWHALECDNVFRLQLSSIVGNGLRSMLRSILPARKRRSARHGLLDASPLAGLLANAFDCRPGEPIDGIRRNLASGALSAVSLMTLDYCTGQSVRWVQGRAVDVFEGPNRRSASAELTVEHVLASSALPFLFPAVRIGNRWYGDGGIRLSAPLSAAVHLGASRIIAMSTGYQRTSDEASTPVVEGYPPAAQMIGQLVNSVFLDVIDEDVARMQRMNDMIRLMEPNHRGSMRAIDLLVLRPSVDLGKLAGAYEKYLPRDLKLVTRALGSRETEVPDFLSLLMFEPHYTKRLMEIGEADVETRLDEIAAFLGEEATSHRATG